MGSTRLNLFFSKIKKFSGKKWCVVIAVLFVCTVPCFSFAATDTPVVDTVRKWDFEDGETGKWKANSQGKQTVTTEALSGKYSLNLNFDDSSSYKHFYKGFKITLDQPILLSEFSFFSFHYFIKGPIGAIRIRFLKDKDNYLHYSYGGRQLIINKPAQLRISRDELKFPSRIKGKYSQEIIGELMSGGIKRIIIEAYRGESGTRKLNTGLQFSFTIDDIVFGGSFSDTIASGAGCSSVAVAARAGKPISIDGKLNDWRGAVPIAITRKEQVNYQVDPGWRDQKDLSAVSMLLWDNEYLYFGAKVRDDKVLCNDTKTGLSMKNDSVCLLLRATQLPVKVNQPLGPHDLIFRMAPFGPKSSKPMLAINQKDFPAKTVQIASSHIPDGYTIEMAIPWQELKITPKENMHFRFFTVVDDYDSSRVKTEMSPWSTRGMFWSDASDWGRLVLTRELTDMEAVSASAMTGSVSPITDKTEYEMNQDITCSLDLWLPLIADASKVKWEIANIETRTVAAELTPLSVVKTPLSTQVLAKWNSGGTDDGTYSLCCKLGEPKQVSLEGQSIKLIGLSAKVRQQKIANAKKAFTSPRAQLEWPRYWSSKKLKARKVPVYTQRVDPAKWSLVKNPVTWEDFGGGFEGSVQCNIAKAYFDLYSKRYNFGRYFRAYNVHSPQLKQHLEEAAKRNILVSFHPPCGKYFMEDTVFKEKHDTIKKIIGRHSLGYEIGEHDGWFFGSLAQRICPNSRREIHKMFWDVHKKNEMRGHKIPKIPEHLVISLSTRNCPHQYGAMGYRMVGQEMGGSSSCILDWTFMRGASKQYGVLSYSLLAANSKWGVRNYTGSGITNIGRSDERPYGPDKGTSDSLLKRLYYLSFLYGACSTGVEVPHVCCVTNEKDEEGYPKLSPVGEMNAKALKWCKKHTQDAGVQYIPVALLIDFAGGWAAPREGRGYKVWGCLPYNKGDYQIDSFFRWIYPQYEEGPFFEDERGTLTSTPLGDKFDILTSDVHQRILNQYQVVCLLGEIEMPPELIKRLKQFVTGGGDLILSAAQAKVLGVDFCGITVSNKAHRGYSGFSLADRKVFEEKKYNYLEVTPKGAKVLAVSEDKLPLITVAESGKGRVIVITPDYWMTTRLKVDDGSDVYPQRYKLLKVVQHILRPYFKDLDFFEIDGSEIQYVVNVTKDNKRLLLTLVNNNKKADWEGTVSLKEGKIISVREWMEEKELPAKQLIKVSVPKGDLRVYEIRADKELFYSVSD